MDGIEHGGGLQRLPAVLGVVPSAVEQDEVRVQLRVERARGRVQERRADQVAGDAIPVLNATLADARSGELFQFPERHCGGFSVRLQDAPVIHRDGKNGHRFGRSTLEVEEDAPIPTVFRCEVFPGHWVHVVTQLEEHIPRDGFAGRQSQPFCSLTDPVTGLGLVLRVVIVVRQMLVEIGRRSGSVLLWFGREHGCSG